MIEDDVAKVFEISGQTWKVKDRETGETYSVCPDAEDVRVALDEAAKNLYDEPVGARFNVGGLIIEKAEKDFIVFALVGRYR